MRARLLPLIVVASLGAAPARIGATDVVGARVHLLRGDAKAAWDVAAEALASSDRPARATVDLVSASASLGRTEEALARVRAREERDPGRGLHELADGVEDRLARSYAEADRALDAALRKLEARGDPEVDVAREQLAIALQDAGRWREALVLHERNASAADPLTEIAAAYGIAYCSLQAKDYARADSLARRVVEEASRRDLPLWLGHAEALLGTLRWIALDVDALLDRLTRALQAYERAGEPSRQASCLRRMAATNLSRGEYPLALKRLHRARDLALEAGDLREASFCLEHLGTASRDLGDEELALSQWRAALEEGGEEWPPEWRSGTLENIGDVEAARGDFEAALGSFARARDELTHTEGRLAEPSLLHRIALCLERSGRPEQALVRLNEAVTLARSLQLVPAEAAALVDAGELHLAAGHPDAAERALRRADELARGSDAPELEIAVLSGRAELARSRGDLPGSLSLLDDAMARAETVRDRSRAAPMIREQVFGRHDRLWSRAIATLAELHERSGDPAHVGRAFDVAQRAKARSLLDLLAESRTRLRSRRDPALHERERRLLDELARLQGEADRAAAAQRDAAAREMRRIEEELAILEAETRRADPRWARAGSPEPLTAQDLPDLLDDGELLLEYWLADDASWLWIGTADSLRMERLPSRADIERDVHALLPLLADYNLLGEDPAYFLEPVRRLSAALLAPARDELAAASRATIVPHGILHYLPFEVLLLGDADGADRFADLPWLVDAVDVAYLPALSLRRQLSQPERGVDGGTELVLIGDPEPVDEVAPLLGRAFDGAVPSRASFAREIDGLATSWHAGPVRRAQGREATAAAARLEAATGRRLVHFTAHGVLNERRPRFSGILLSPDPQTGDDGFLTVDEVADLELPCDQVVLSACSTALGRETTGEGLVGLTRAFFYAGARSVVASLWEVPSGPTTRLMLDFYRGIGPGEGRVHALAEAKRAAIRAGASPAAGRPDPAHPCLWAGFVMIGADG